MKVKLSEVSSGFTKNIAQKDLDNNNGCYPIYGASGYIKNINFYISDKPYIGIVKDGSGVGRVNIYPAYSSLLGTMQYVVPNDNMDIAYLMYALRYMKLGSLYSGAAIPHIYYKNYQRNELNYREKNEQKSISTQLTQIENAILVCNAKIIALDELVKSRFIEMFGDIRISSIFPNIALENFAQIGSSKRVHAADYVESGVPFYRSKEIIELGNGQEPSVELFISKKQYESIKKTNGVPCKGDILMSAVGTIGKMWIVDGRKDFYYKDGNIISIHSEETNPIYLKEALANLIDDFKSANVAGSAYSALTIVKLKKMTVPMPPMSIQNEFADFVKLIDKSKFIVQKQIDDLQELLDSKMDEYFG